MWDHLNMYQGDYFRKIVKVGLSHSKRFSFICFSPLKMTKNAFYFILKSFFVLKIFEFLS